MASAHPTQIYLVVEVPSAAAARAEASAALARVLALPRAAALISAVLLVAAAGAALDPGIAPLIDVAQKRGAAAILAGDARLARTLRADGVHLLPSDDPMTAYAEAREILGNRFIVGADAGGSRHDAMSLGEAGADYLGFGPDAADPALRRDLVAWWSEIFEVPCVALGAARADDAADLAAAGADFVGVRLPPAHSPGDAAAWLDELASAVRRDAPDTAAATSAAVR